MYVTYIMYVYTYIFIILCIYYEYQIVIIQLVDTKRLEDQLRHN